MAEEKLNNNNNYIINNEELFKEIPEVNPVQKEYLEDNIKSNGCLIPIKVWGDFIIDGRARYDICVKNKIEFKVEKVKAKDKKEARYLIIKSILEKKWINRININQFTKIKILNEYIDEIKESFDKKEPWTLEYKELIKDKFKKLDLRFLTGNEIVSKENCQLIFTILKSKNEVLIELVKNNKINYNDAQNLLKSIKIDEKEESEEENYITFDFIVNELINTLRMFNSGLKMTLDKVCKQTSNDNNKAQIIKLLNDEHKKSLNMINDVFVKFSKKNNSKVNIKENA